MTASHEQKLLVARTLLRAYAERAIVSLEDTVANAKTANRKAKAQVSIEKWKRVLISLKDDSQSMTK